MFHLADAHPSEPTLPEPKLSLALFLEGTAEERQSALYSLSSPHQKNVTDPDYEIVVVEVPSADALGEERARAQASNVAYRAYEPDADRAASALDVAFALSRAPLVAFVEGARIATPRVVELAVQGARMARDPLIVVPSYDLGLPGSGPGRFTEILGRIDWRAQRYGLFEAAWPSEMNPKGYLTGLTHAECFVCSRAAYEALRSEGRGGGPGAKVDDLYGALLSDPARRLIVLGGEGVFRQSQGAHTSLGSGADSRHDRDPLLFGVMPGSATHQLRVSIERVAAREARRARE